MADRKASGPECECGEVVFDLADKSPGSILRCPWCRKRYRLEDDRTLTLLGDRSGAPTNAPPPSGSGRRTDEEAEGKVEVFRYDSDEKRPERPATKKERPPSRARLPRTRDGAADPTVRLDRISRRQTRGDGRARFPDEGFPGAASDPTEPLNRISRRTRREEPPLEENGVPFDELPPVKPLDLEKWVFRAGLGLVPVGTLIFMGWVIYGVYSGQRDFVTHRIFGLTIRGDNPWVWFGGIVLGGLVFLGLWVGYVYFFVHKRKRAEMEKRRREQEAGRPASERRSTRRHDEADDA